MKGKIPLYDVALWFIILLVLLPASKPVFAAASHMQRDILLTEAINGKQVEAWAQPNPNSMGFRKSMLIVHLKNLTGTDLKIQIAPGTQYISNNPAYASMIQVKPANVTLGQAEQQVEVEVLSLNHDGAFPPAMEDTYRYQVGNASVDSRLSQLLDKIASRDVADKFGAQLAVWSVVENIPVEQLPGKLTKLKVAPAETADAQSLLGLPVVTIQPTENEATPESPIIEKNSKGGIIGVIVGAAIVLVVLVAAITTLGDKGKRKPQFLPDGEDLPDDRGGRKVVDTQKDRKITEDEHHSSQRIILKACSGPMAGQTFDLEVPGIISRGHLEWAILPDGCVSSPHAAFDLVDSAYRVKDLNSGAGVWIDQQRLQKKFVDWPLGHEIRLGSDLQLISIESGMMVQQGKLSGTIINRSQSIIVASRKELPVLVVGRADKRISDAHVLFTMHGKDIVIRDLNSTNGTLVNQQRVEIEAVIKRGDHVQIGETVFEIQLGS